MNRTEERTGSILLAAILAAGGGLLLAGSWVSPVRALVSMRQATFLTLQVALCGPLLLSIGAVTGAAWLRPFQHCFTTLVRTVPAAALLFYLALLGSLGLHVESGDGFRGWWLDPLFLAIRAAFILGIWTIASRRLAEAIETGERPRSVHRRAVLFLILFAPTFWVSCVDWIMSLASGWQSTIFPFYNFSGLLLTAAALTGILAGRPAGSDPNGQPRALSGRSRDAGNLLLFASCFWAYLWFSQYMLIWYAGIPEESVYFIRRTTQGWSAILLLALALNWLVPFLGLLSRWMKTDPPSLVQISLIVLCGRWVDLYLMFLGDQGGFGLGQLLLDLGPTLILLAATLRFQDWLRGVQRAGVSPA